MKPFVIPRDRANVVVTPVAGRSVQLTNLNKVYFPETGFTKGDVLQYYADVGPLIVPYLAGRALVLKRYPGGIDDEFFYMKRTPPNAPEWLRRCPIAHGSGRVIEFPMVDDIAGLLWIVNLGCIDMNEWYSRCDDTDRPDYLHFDLDPVDGTPFATVRAAALHVRDGLEGLGMKPLVKTTGSSGMHVYVAIARGPMQKQVWTFAKAYAQTLERMFPETITAEYKIEKRPPGRVLVDYNQNRWGSTLASVYSVRAKPRATVSTPVTWDEVERGLELDEFRLDNVRARFAEVGDLWAPMKAKRGRFDLLPFLEPEKKSTARRQASAAEWCRRSRLCNGQFHRGDSGMFTDIETAAFSDGGPGFRPAPSPKIVRMPELRVLRTFSHARVDGVDCRNDGKTVWFLKMPSSELGIGP